MDLGRVPVLPKTYSRFRKINAAKKSFRQDKRAFSFGRILEAQNATEKRRQ